MRCNDGSHSSVHESGLCEPGTLCKVARLLDHSRCTPDLPGYAWRHSGAVGPNHNIRVEKREKRLKVTTTRGSRAA